MTTTNEMATLVADWRAIEAWDASIANDRSFHISTRKEAAKRAAVARRYAEECETEAAKSR